MKRALLLVAVVLWGQVLNARLFHDPAPSYDDFCHRERARGQVSDRERTAPPARDPAFEMHLDAPISTWDEAVPLGNGMTGGLLWGESDTLRLSLDRADLWDLRTPATYLADDWNYKTVQQLVEARDQKELVRRFDAPFEEIPYPTKLPGARLELQLGGRSLQRFALDMRKAVGTAMFDSGRADVFFSATDPVALVRVRGARPAPRLVPPTALSKLGYAAATTGHDATSVWLRQETEAGGSYAVCVSSRTVGADTEMAIAISSSREQADPLALARARSAAALRRGFDRMLVPHEAWWRRFWAASSVTLPDAAVQQHYNLVEYFYGAASRKGSPPMPLQGVWTADAGSLPPWKGDFHFDLNVQLTYWPYLSAGHFDEGSAYLDFMWGLVPAHRKFARRFFDADGIVVPGVMALDGQPLGGWGMYSLSPVQGAWVAHAFYLHWRYTADPQFLAQRAYPYCTLVAQGLLSLMKAGASGTLRLPLSSSPEIHDNTLAAWMTPPSNYDLSLIRWLFTALSEMATAAGKTDEAPRWTEVQRRLDPLAVDGVSGVLKVSPTEMLAESHRHLSHLMAIHPLGLLTVDGPEADRRIIDASLDNLASLGTRNWCGYSFAWASCMEARAGRAEPARRYLDTYLKAFVLRNGFHANGDQTRSGYSDFTYRPFTLEGNFAAAQAVHEMLLQSWGGTIRVFPATPASWRDLSFAGLRGEGGYRISARRSGGRTSEIRVEASRNGTLRVRDPFGATGRWTSSGRRVSPGRTGDVLEFSVRAGQTLIGQSGPTPPGGR